MRLPNLSHIIPRDVFINGNESHLLSESGGDKQTVKRVTMNKGQRFEGSKVSSFDWYLLFRLISLVITP